MSFWRVPRLWRGETVAILEGWIGEEEDNVTITNAEGDPLTAAELAALGQVFDMMGELSQWAEGLLEFAAELAYLSQPIG